MSFGRITEIVQFFWMFESQAQQRLAWDDAAQARIARDRAETRSAAQLDAMLDANPSGSLGNAQLDDLAALDKSGLL